MLLEREPKLLVTYGKKLITHLHSTGTGGNSSILNWEKKLIAITPTGLEHLDTRPEDIVLLNFDGERQTAAQKVDRLFLPLLEMMLQPLALAKPSIVFNFCLWACPRIPYCFVIFAEGQTPTLLTGAHYETKRSFRLLR